MILLHVVAVVLSTVVLDPKPGAAVSEMVPLELLVAAKV